MPDHGSSSLVPSASIVYEPDRGVIGSRADLACGQLRPAGLARVASALIRSSPCVGSAPDRMPQATSQRTMAVSNPEEGAMNRILIATDGSDSAREALEFGLDLADEQDAWAFVVHVSPTVDALPNAGFGFLAPTVPHEFCERDRVPLHEAIELAAEKDLNIRIELLKGNPADEIVAFADTI